MRCEPVFRYLGDDDVLLGEKAKRSVTLSSDQSSALDRVLAWQRRRSSLLLTLGGYAGTGKSTLIAEVARELSDKVVAFVAYTGKAVNGLRQKLRAAGSVSLSHSSSTIHSLIYQPMMNESGHIRWSRRDRLDADLIIIDEASMVDAALLSDLMSYKVPIFAVGDHGQLPPVHGESVLMQNPDLRLDQIHRQAAGNPIIRLSQMIRESGDLPRGFPSSDSVQVVDSSTAFRVLSDMYIRGEDVGVLAYTNKSRQWLNREARSLRYGCTPNLPQDGDSIICLRNRQGILFNGMRGAVAGSVAEDKHWWHGNFLFEDDELEVEGCVLKSQFGRDRTYSAHEEIAADNRGLVTWDWDQVGLLFDYGYALTVHKSQGAQFKNVFLLYEKHWRLEADAWRRWLYTGVTRATDRLYVML